MRAAAPVLTALALAGCAHSGASPAVRYVDAHSHILAEMHAEDEIAMMRRAGLAGVVIMSPDPEALARIVAVDPGFVTPFVSIARTRDMKGIRLDDDSAARFAALHAAGAICGFGEIPTRLEPNPEPSDAAAIANAFRTRIYAEADRLRVPVNVHVSLENPEVVAAVERAVAAYPGMKLILAHSGWSAEAGLIGRLLAAHPNLYADLSVRLGPAEGWPAPGTSGPALPNRISILGADGALLPEWRALIEHFPDRFLFGLDITSTGSGRAHHIDELMAASRHALGQLPRGVEHAVSHGNIERLLKGCRRD
ncbi:MAG: amidohydrolase family protein [Sphingomonas sp.]|uniref:amidohydrolase family protein n=1 Tax=Sphingomonas sp. TaxID=28214 RepID=UPI002274ADE5|nr:amidohydrolase family protein [Sphingomonas sp.]MCX8477828.1 amidohydrolase family protein [Sphingomonas sp.]